jgi:hypothetical protein
MVIDAVKYEAQETGFPTGRYPGADEFYSLKNPTRGAPNSQIRVRILFIKRIMYAPVSHDEDDEYVELYNKGSNVVNI